MRQTHRANVQLFAGGLSKKNTGDSEMVVARRISHEEIARLQIYKKSMDSTDRQSGALGNFRSREPAVGLPEELQHAKAALQRGNVVFA